MPRTLATLFVLLIFLLSAQSFASRPYDYTDLGSHTIEALTARSPLIVTGIVTSASRIDNGLVVDLDSIQVVKSSKAVPSQLHIVDYFPHFPFKTPPIGSKILAFIEDDRFSPPCVFDCVILAPPNNPGSLFFPTIRDLTLQPVTDSAKVLAIVQSELRRSPPTTSVQRFSVSPFDLHALPADNRLLPAARQWVRSADPLPRYLAASVFLAHPEPQDGPALYSLLNDPFTSDVPGFLSPWSGREYLIRQAAVQALRKLSLPVPPIDLYQPRTGLYHPFPIFSYTLLSLIPLLAYATFRRIRRHRVHNAHPTFRQSLLAYLTVASLCLTLPLIHLWHRTSLDVTDDFVCANHGCLLNLTSQDGYVYFEFATNWPGNSPLVHASRVPEPWNEDLNLRQASFRHGYQIRWGSTPPWQIRISTSGRDIYEPFSGRTGIRLACSHCLLEIYDGYLLLLFLLLPAARLILPPLSKLRHHVRTRRALKHHLCPICSYDLRAHTPGQRCPECGTPIGPAAQFPSSPPRTQK